MPDPRSLELSIQKISGATIAAAADHVAVEEPLEIRIAYGPAGRGEGRGAGRAVKPVAVTMRTPGHRAGGGAGVAGVEEDFELAVGFLYAEGIVHSAAEVERVAFCGPETMPHRLQNVVRVELSPGATFDAARLERHFFTNSSCGICGKTTLAALQTLRPDPLTDDFSVPPDLLHALPELLREAQPVFDRTGGLHAAALFTRNGKLVALREDVGRHNALDKLVGSQFFACNLPLSNHLLLLSGRASFELLQKAIMAGIPVVAAVGAPSSLAVELARQFNVTLAGFLRNNRFNLYAGESRIAPPAPAAPARIAKIAPPPPSKPGVSDAVGNAPTIVTRTPNDTRIQ